MEVKRVNKLGRIVYIFKKIRDVSRETSFFFYK